MLCEFVATHREEILARARSRVSARSSPAPTEVELTEGLPAFFDQLREALRMTEANEPFDHAAIRDSAGRHGDALFHRGLTVGQVVHDYGDLCQVITGLAVEQGAPIAADEFQTLNVCLDDAIAGAVTAYGRQRERAISAEGTERLGALAHEMRNVLNTAFLSFTSIKKGIVGPAGSTSAVLDMSLMQLGTLIDRSLADVRLDSGVPSLELVPVGEVLAEVGVGASMIAQTKGLGFAVTSVDPAVTVEADRQLLVATVANLVQNALKFTRPGTTVRLAATTTSSRVLIDVEDECGGVPSELHASLSRPFVRGARDSTGLGLGLSICVKAVKAIGGELRIRDVPGRGCVFTVDLAKQPPQSTSPRVQSI